MRREKIERNRGGAKSLSRRGFYIQSSQNLNEALKLNLSEEEIKIATEISEGFVAYGTTAIPFVKSGGIANLSRHEIIDKRIDTIFSDLEKISSEDTDILFYISLFGSLHRSDVNRITGHEIPTEFRVCCLRTGEYERIIPDVTSHRIFERSICGKSDVLEKFNVR